MSIGIVDIGLGNLGSLRNALSSQGWDTITVRTATDFVGLSHLFLPGVGAFSAAMSRLAEAGLIAPIRHFALQGRPIMGICLGMQLLADSGEEGGQKEGLALMPGIVEPMIGGANILLPHIGWNEARQVRQHPLLSGIRNDVDFYFVHSYRFSPFDPTYVLAETDYGERFPSIVAKGSVVGAQFHPEKSQANGLRLLDNFCLWDGQC